MPLVAHDLGEAPLGTQIGRELMDSFDALLKERRKCFYKILHNLDHESFEAFKQATNKIMLETGSAMHFAPEGVISEQNKEFNKVLENLQIEVTLADIGNAFREDHEPTEDLLDGILAKLRALTPAAIEEQMIEMEISEFGIETPNADINKYLPKKQAKMLAYLESHVGHPLFEKINIALQERFWDVYEKMDMEKLAKVLVNYLRTRLHDPQFEEIKKRIRDQNPQVFKAIDPADMRKLMKEYDKSVKSGSKKWKIF